MMINLNDPLNNEVDTKLKIMIVANELFARNGFDGVSIRDIAQAAEVNIASINYHFNNKLNLFHSIFEYNYRWMEDAVVQLDKEKKLNTGAMASELFRIFSSNGHSLINSFNIILNEHLSPPQDDLTKEGESFGPPGSQVLLEVITREVGEEVPFEERDWAMRMIFSNIFHNAVLVNTDYLQRKCAGEEWMKPGVKEKSMEKLGEAIVSSLKK